MPPTILNRTKIGRNVPCPCGSGKKYKKCCGDPSQIKKEDLSLGNDNQPNLFERNLILLHAIEDIFGRSKWQDLKRNISGRQVRELYGVIATLWTPSTDLPSLLPTDNKLRGLYLGEVEPDQIARHIFRFGLYADEILIMDPFHNPHFMKAEFNPLENPSKFKADTLKLIYFTAMLAPWIEAGLVKLVPDPGGFNPALGSKLMSMAEARYKEMEIGTELLDEMDEIDKRAIDRMFYSFPRHYKIEQMKEAIPGITDEEINAALEYMDQVQREDPVAFEQPIDKSGGQLIVSRSGASLETALYLCHLTGAFPYTSMKAKWKEILSAGNELSNDAQTWAPLTRAFQQLEFKFLNNVDTKFAFEMRRDGRLESFRTFMRKVWRTSGGELDPNKIDAVARDFKDELTDEYRKAEADWARIDRDLVQWVSGGLAAGTLSAIADAIVNGGFNIALPALGFSATGVLKLLTSRMERKEFRKKVPMSVFVDLSHYKPKVNP